MHDSLDDILRAEAFTRTGVSARGDVIVYASRDVDDAWLFHAATGWSDPVLCSVGELVAIDPSLREVLQLRRGQSAKRSPGGQWEF